MTAFDIDTDIEPTPLKKTTPSSSGRSFTFHRNYKWLVPLFLGIFAAAAFLYLGESRAVEAGFLAEDVTVKYTSSDGGSDIVSASSTGKQKKPGMFSKVFGTPSPTPPPNPAPSNPPTLAPTTKPENPLSTFPKMLLAFQAKREEWYNQLKIEYGTDFFTNLLLPRGPSLFPPPSEKSERAKQNPDYSTNRFRRQLMIKFLEAQEAALNQRSRTHKRPKFVWATGGHRYVT